MEEVLEHTEAEDTEAEHTEVEHTELGHIEKAECTNKKVVYKLNDYYMVQQC